MARAAPITLDDLRRHAVARSLFAPTTLPRAIAKLGFVQADPIRAPARAQDLTLRHRVRDYRAGDLERRYPQLAIEEDFFVNYGFLPRATHHLMHPRTPRTPWPKAQRARADAVLAFVRERGVAHPDEVDSQFQHGRSRNWFGGSSRASTQLLDSMHYRGFLRIAGRAGGVRTYAVREPQPAPADAEAALDALVDVVVAKYAPLPERSLAELVNHLRGGVPQWVHLRRAAFERAKARLATSRVEAPEGIVNWYWPAREDPRSPRHAPADTVRLLAPFDPVVWDRRRFELLWGWAYRFEAYTPAPKRQRGYYALPLLWRDRVVGWANVSAAGAARGTPGGLQAELGYVAGRAPSGVAYRRALDEELERLRLFLSPR